MSLPQAPPQEFELAISRNSKTARFMGDSQQSTNLHTLLRSQEGVIANLDEPMERAVDVGDRHKGE